MDKSLIFTDITNIDNLPEEEFKALRNSNVLSFFNNVPILMQSDAFNTMTNVERAEFYEQDERVRKIIVETSIPSML